MKSDNPYDRSVRSLNNSDSYEFSGESEYSRERSDPYQMVDYMIDRGLDYRGLGPKGFSLSDERIREDVCEILARDSEIDASEMEVEVKDGVVFLKGRVENRQTKRMAELNIENLPGVNDVVNQLRFR
jgi:osmotically-inducible protein OsmY